MSGLNGDLPNTLPDGSDIDKFSISPNGSRVVYLGDQDVYDEDELFGVRIGEENGIYLPFIPLLLID